MVCQLHAQNCADGSPRDWTLPDGRVVSIPPPTITGHSSACWVWEKQYLCVETDPIYECKSGTAYANVKADCSLTAATINETMTINSITYIMSADYDYRCHFSEYTCDRKMPGDKECVLLTQTVTDTATVPSAPVGAAPSTGFGTPPTTAPLTSEVVTEQRQDNNYVCYGTPVTTCSTMCQEVINDPVSGKMETRDVPCNSPVSNCVGATSQCKSGPDSTTASGYKAELGPDGRCVHQLDSSTCQTGEIPKCLSNDQCDLVAVKDTDIQPNGMALTQEQSYICSNETETCAETAEVSNCLSVNAWGWDRGGLTHTAGDGLGEFNQAMAKIDGIQRGMNANDIFIFSGQSRKCRIPIGNFLNTIIMTVFAIALVMVFPPAAGGLAGGGLPTLANGLVTMGMTTTQAATASVALSATSSFLQDAPTSKAFGTNCCKDYIIEGSDKWYKMGSCTETEVKLAVARRKGLYHYLGDYCSKKSGFPVKQCVEKTKSYCTFDDLLALVVNLEGRKQLDQIAAADPATTKPSPAMAVPLYADEVTPAGGTYAGMNNGGWIKLTTFQNSQIWAWKWPGYCRTSEKQKAAYDRYEAELTQRTGLQGQTVTGHEDPPMSVAEAKEVGNRIINAPSFQDCPETPGAQIFMTCDKTDDSCDVARLPEGPDGGELGLDGTDVSTSDPNWQIQRVTSFKMPGDYGVTATMPTNPSFAAVQSSLSAYVTAVGSCHTTGNCLYYFSVTDKKSAGGMGAKKRLAESVNFPLYSLPSYTRPAVSYVSPTGFMDPAAYAADTNAGLGEPLALNMHRFIFRPNTINTMPSPGGNIHTHVLLEWGSGPIDEVNPRSGVEPLLVPTNLPPGTPGWWPWGTASNNDRHFYLSGSCDPNSRWCNYDIEVDLTVHRHPWGSAKYPRCWGFTIEQMAALDFDKMDLSRWIDSLNLDSVADGLSEQAAAAMTTQAEATAQGFYQAFKTGETIAKPEPGQRSLFVNTNVLPMLSSDEESSYTVRAVVPANWPQWFDAGGNNNPVTNVWVNWGDGSPPEQMVIGGKDNRAWQLAHDYGDLPVGTYTLTVTLDTHANGAQRLGTDIKIMPNDGAMPKNQTKLEFDRDGMSGESQDNYRPGAMPNGNGQDAQSLETLAPGMADRFTEQGNSID